MTQPVCQAAIDLIKQFEGCDLTAYRCSAGQASIGYGSTKGLSEADIGKLTITQEEADRRLVEDIDEAARIVDGAVKVPLTANQRGSCVSLCFNAGPGTKGVKDGFVWLKSGSQSTLLRRLNEGRYADAAEEFPKWSFSGGKRLAGLVRRRAAEKALFLTPDGQEAVMPAPTPTPTPTPAPVVPPHSPVGSGAYASLAGAPAAWIIAMLWNTALPTTPMPIEVAAALGSAISTGLYFVADYLKRNKEPAL